MFTVDTNILVYYAAGDKRVADFVLENLAKDRTLFLSTIAVVEFFSYPELTQRDRELFETLLPKLYIIAPTFEIALLAAQLRREYKLKLGDAVIAATTLRTNSTLVTRNLRDFKKIPSLKLLHL